MTFGINVRSKMYDDSTFKKQPPPPTYIPPEKEHKASIMKESKKVNSPIKTTIQEYSENTTIHGIFYAFEKDIHVFSNVLWCLIVLAGFIIALVMTTQAYFNWQNSPVLTTIKNTGKSISELEYPAITICSQGIVEDIIVNAVDLQFWEYLVDKGKTSGDFNATYVINADWQLYNSFMAENYPGVEGSPADLMTLLTSINPNSVVKSEVAIGRGVQDCPNNIYGSDATIEPLGSTCSSGFVMDKDEYRCYKNMDSYTFNEAVTQCTKTGGILISPESIEDVEGLHKLIKDGNLTGITESTKIWLNYERAELYEGWNPFITWDGQEVANSNFPSNLNVATDTNTHNCMSMIYKDKGTTLFEAAEEDCNSQKLVICMNQAIPICPDDASVLWTSDTPESTDWPITTTDVTITTTEVSNTTEAVRRKRQAAAETNTDTPSTLELLLDPQRKQEAAQALALQKERYKQQFKSMDLSKSYSNLFKTLWYSHLPCFDIKDITFRSNSDESAEMLKKCIWKGTELPCSSIFETSPTDAGMCCTFNLEKAESMFKKSKFADQVLEGQKYDKKNTRTGKAKKAKSFENGTEPTPQVGKNKGLTVILDAHTNMLSASSVSDDFQGFKVVVDARGQFPLVQRKSLLLKPGYDNSVIISATRIETESNLINIDYSKRNCYFRDEKAMNIHKHYSQANCLLECGLDHARTEMAKMNQSCTPWYFPVQDKHIKMCDPWEAAQFLTFYQNVNDETCECLPDCTTTMYQATVSAAKFRKCDYKNLGTSPLCNMDDPSKIIDPPMWFDDVVQENNGTVPDYIKQYKSNVRRFVGTNHEKNAVFPNLIEDDEEGYYDAYEEDIAMVNFFFEASTVMEFARANRMTEIDFVSQVGGLLGLFIGFSIISGAELIYWASFRLFRNMNRRKIDDG